MRKNAVLLIYGGGGHREQMRRLHRNLSGVLNKEVAFVGICEKGHPLDEIARNYCIFPLRDKHGVLINILKTPYSFISSIYCFLQAAIRYRIRLVVSTGPGIAIAPFIIGRLLGARTVFIESWSRFYSPSLTGRVIYRVADEFYIQSEALRAAYPNAAYHGLL